MRFRLGALAVPILAALAAATPASAAPRTLHVCAKGKGCLATVQRAVTVSRPGDTIAIAPGTYRGRVAILGARRAGIRLVGDAKTPGSVILDGDGAPTALTVEATRDVSVRGLTIRNATKEGVAISASRSIRLADLAVHDTGAYGVRVTSSLGGVFDRIDASGASTAGFSIGATPPQDKPRRTYVRRLDAHENGIGFEAVNARYVTLSRSRLFNDGTGIALTASPTLPNPPAEDNLVRANEVFWNNYEIPGDTGTGTAAANPAAPTGAGIYLFGARANVIELNHVFGNWLVGLGAAPNFLLALTDAGAADLRRNVVRLNDFGLGGRDRNGRDLAYDGSGRGNCFEDNRGVRTAVPSDKSTLVPCLPPTDNVEVPEALAELRSWSPPAEHWIRHSHASRPGLRPIE